MRERKNSLVDMSRSRDRIVERLHALKKASEAELEKKALLAQSAEVRNSERQASLRSFCGLSMAFFLLFFVEVFFFCSVFYFCSK